MPIREHGKHRGTPARDLANFPATKLDGEQPLILDTHSITRRGKCVGESHGRTTMLKWSNRRAEPR